ncbi:IPT/TIG domain-containing protein [Nocardia sp. NPDC101769]|uniref:IPT/TIG domain-containing protein n=1 Tax=Nocardia sp. NPDC101769 TaxID=3364333 RepID=UPI003801AD93
MGDFATRQPCSAIGPPQRRIQPASKPPNWAIPDGNGLQIRCRSASDGGLLEIARSRQDRNPLQDNSFTVFQSGGRPMSPILTSLTPSFGPEAGRNSVTITGSGFANVGPLTVQFGATATTFTIVSDTQITAIAPPGTGTVQVTVAANLDGTSNPLPYIYGPGLLYVTDSANPGTVYSVPATGGAATVLATGLNQPRGLTRVGNTLYIAEFGANRVVSVPTTGGPITPLVTTGLVGPIDVVAAGGTLFITDSGSLRVVSAPIGGGSPTLVAAVPTGAIGLTF